MRFANFCFGVLVFLAVWTAHCYSYVGAVARLWVTYLLVFTFIASLPLFSLFWNVVRGNVSSKIWPLFWAKALARCPRLVAAFMSVAWILMVVALIRHIFGNESLMDQFQTAALAILASATLCYDVTLLRTTKSCA
jgi:hypothetical protein